MIAPRRAPRSVGAGSGAAFAALVLGGLACAGQHPGASRGLVGGAPAPRSASPTAPAVAGRAPDIAAEIGRRDAAIREAAIQRLSGAPPAVVEQRIAGITAAIGATLEDRYPQEQIAADVASAVEEATRHADVQRSAATIARQREFHDRYLGRPAGLDEALDAEAPAIDRIALLRNDRATAADADALMVEVARRVRAKVPGASEARVRMDLITRVSRRQGELLRGSEGPGKGGTFLSRIAARADGPLHRLGETPPKGTELEGMLDEAWSGRPDRAVVFYRQAFERNESFLSLRPWEPYGRGRTAQDFYRATIMLSDVIATVAETNPRHAGAVRLAYESLLAGRARSLEAERRLSSALVGADDAEARKARAEMREVRARIAAIELQRAAGARPSADEEQESTRLADEEQRLYQVLARAAHIERTKDLPFQAAPAVDALQSALGDGEVLLSYFEYRRTDRAHPGDRYWWPRRYGVFVLGRTNLSWVPLGSADEIDSQVDGYLRLLANARVSVVAKQAEARRLGGRLLGPIATALTGARALRIFCDGTLQLLPFAALDDGSGWLAERYELSYGVAERQRLGEHVGRQGVGGALIVVGGPYGGAAQAPLVAGERLRPEHFPSVPGMAAEAARIAALLPEARVVGPGETGDDLLSRPGLPPLVLHIAAHGVFLPFAQAGAAGSRGLVLTSMTSASEPVPAAPPQAPLTSSSADAATGLLRSALVVGRGAGSGPAVDGFLTGYEVAGADLWGTELVVLSACESGRGAPDRARGVQGLRAAFFSAGVRTLVTSLWSVDDEATRDLMETFYTSLRQGIGRADALTRASASVRVKRPDPYYWTPFILLGDAGPIPSRSGSVSTVVGEDPRSRRLRAMAARRREHTIDAVGNSSWAAFGANDTALDDHVQRPTTAGGALLLNLVGDRSALSFAVESYRGPGVYRIGEGLLAAAARVTDPVALQINKLAPANLEARAVRGHLTMERDDDGVVGAFELELVNGGTASGRFAVPSLVDVLPAWLRRRAR